VTIAWINFTGDCTKVTVKWYAFVRFLIAPSGGGRHASSQKQHEFMNRNREKNARLSSTISLFLRSGPNCGLGVGARVFPSPQTPQSRFSSVLITKTIASSATHWLRLGRDALCVTRHNLLEQARHGSPTRGRGVQPVNVRARSWINLLAALQPR